MSYYQLGQVQNASNALTLSRNLADRNGGQGSWFDWTLGRILMNEAAALIQKQAAYCIHSAQRTRSAAAPAGQGARNHRQSGVAG